MGFEQVMLLAVLVVVFVADRIEKKGLHRLPEQERVVVEELLVPLWIPFLLMMSVIIVELVRIAVEGYSTLWRMAPPVLGFLAVTVAYGIRLRAYGIYELAAGQEDFDRKARARALLKNARWSYTASVVLWASLALYRS